MVCWSSFWTIQVFVGVLRAGKIKKKNVDCYLLEEKIKKPKKEKVDCYLLEENIKKENVWNIIEPMSSVSLRNAFEDNPKRFKRTTAVTGSETQFGRTSEPP